jgi:hypothetical protein
MQARGYSWGAVHHTHPGGAVGAQTALPEALPHLDIQPLSMTSFAPEYETKVMKVVAGVDTSTQSCKVELRSLEDFELVASGSAPHPPASPPSSEQSPEAWWQALVLAFKGALAAAPAMEVEAISIAGSATASCHWTRPGASFGPPSCGTTRQAMASSRAD